MGEHGDIDHKRMHKAVVYSFLSVFYDKALSSSAPYGSPVLSEDEAVNMQC